MPWNPAPSIRFPERCIPRTMIQKDDDHTLAPEEIITMNWLADNVIGSIPDFEMLADEARPVVRLQGLRKPKDGGTI